MRIVSSACAGAPPSDPSAMATSSATRRAVLDCNTRHILFLCSSPDAKLSWANCRRARRSRNRSAPHLDTHVDTWDMSQRSTPLRPDPRPLPLGPRPPASIASSHPCHPQPAGTPRTISLCPAGRLGPAQAGSVPPQAPLWPRSGPALARGQQLQFGPPLVALSTCCTHRPSMLRRCPGATKLDTGSSSRPQAIPAPPMRVKGRRAHL